MHGCGTPRTIPGSVALQIEQYLTPQIISDPANEVFVSPANYWEFAIKVSLGKYPLTVPFEDFISHAIDGNDFEIHAIEPRHVAEVLSLPMHHKDPFDRLLIAQGLAEQMPIVSSDATFDAYAISRLW